MMDLFGKREIARLKAEAVARADADFVNVMRARNAEKELSEARAIIADLKTRTIVYCSFCGKSNGDVSNVIAGKNVYICNECVGACNLILDAALVKREGA